MTHESDMGRSFERKRREEEEEKLKEPNRYQHTNRMKAGPSVS